MAQGKSSNFVIGVRDLVGAPGHMREMDLQLSAPERWGEGLVSVQAAEPIDCFVRLESVHEGILVSAEVKSHSEGVCGRCLKDIRQSVEVDFQELFAYSSNEDSDFLVEADSLDLEPLLRDTVVLALPFQPVCGDDCYGLDPETGLRREAPAPQEDKPRMDPRWARLAELRGEEAK